MGPANSRLFVGNIDHSIDQQKLFAVFSEHGGVIDAFLVNDPKTSSPRGFGFVTMASHEEAQAAINALNGTEVEGRVLNVSLAMPRRSE